MDVGGTRRLARLTRDGERRHPSARVEAVESVHNPRPTEDATRVAWTWEVAWCMGTSRALSTLSSWLLCGSVTLTVVDLILDTSVIVCLRVAFPFFQIHKSCRRARAGAAESRSPRELPCACICCIACRCVVCARRRRRPPLAHAHAWKRACRLSRVASVECVSLLRTIINERYTARTALLFKICISRGARARARPSPASWGSSVQGAARGASAWRAVPLR